MRATAIRNYHRAVSLGLALRIARRLGPWTPETYVARAIERREIEVGAKDDAVRVRLYSPRRRAEGSVLLVPGLHFAGPAEARMDRFASMLAETGIVVAAPFLRDFLDLKVGPRLLTDTSRAFDALREERPGDRPAIFSISFGSLPALALGAARSDEIGGVIVFGGYADFADAMRFAIGGRGERAHDPLNRPVVFINLLPFFPEPPLDAPALAKAWREFVVRTWGKPEMKVREAWEDVARDVERELSSDRSLYRRGVGLAPGGIELAEAALARAERAFDYLDPTPHVRALRAPARFVHGRDDDVIPFEHAAILTSLATSSSDARSFLTGLYGHTGKTGLRALLAKGPALVNEARSMVGIVGALSSFAKGGSATVR
jgi:pimeloyl-ACP methyl ester carboxylesterase